MITDPRLRFYFAALVTPLLVSLSSLVIVPLLGALGVFDPLNVVGGPFTLTARFQPGAILDPTFWEGTFRAYVGWAIGGTPALLVLRWRGWASRQAYAVAGLIVAVLAVYVLGIFTARNVGHTTMAMALAWPLANLLISDMFFVIPAIVGPLTGTIFWAIARPDRRPDLGSPMPENAGDLTLTSPGS